MEKAKAAIKDFTSRVGHHDTTVHETVAPAVQHETVKPHQHEEVHTAVDREVHQDHYHRTIQPIHDREVLPEKHTANLGAVQHREFDHRDHDGTRRALAADQSGFKDERVVEGTTHSQSAAATVGGEHVHHHVHETIQPVIEKETIQPTVVHTTVPIHEVHHNAAKHHNASVLPALSMSQYKERGGVLGGREERYDGFEGEPKNIGGLAHGILHGKRDSHHSDSEMKTPAQHGDFDPTDGHSNNLGGSNREARHLEEKAGVGSGAGLSRDSSQESGRTGVGHAKHKPSLMDRVNPKIDANGDGKAGFMK